MILRLSASQLVVDSGLRDHSLINSQQQKKLWTKDLSWKQIFKIKMFRRTNANKTNYLCYYLRVKKNNQHCMHTIEQLVFQLFSKVTLAFIKRLPLKHRNIFFCSAEVWVEKLWLSSKWTHSEYYNWEKLFLRKTEVKSSLFFFGSKENFPHWNVKLNIWSDPKEKVDHHQMDPTLPLVVEVLNRNFYGSEKLKAFMKFWMTLKLFQKKSFKRSFLSKTIVPTGQSSKCFDVCH